jgi:hypothetical protein
MVECHKELCPEKETCKPDKNGNYPCEIAIAASRERVMERLNNLGTQQINVHTGRR